MPAKRPTATKKASKGAKREQRNAKATHKATGKNATKMDTSGARENTKPLTPWVSHVMRYKQEHNLQLLGDAMKGARSSWLERKEDIQRRKREEDVAFRALRFIQPKREFQQDCVKVHGKDPVLKIEKASKITGGSVKTRDLNIYPVDPDAETSSATEYYLQWSDPNPKNTCYGVITVSYDALKKFFKNAYDLVTYEIRNFVEALQNFNEGLEERYQHLYTQMLTIQNVDKTRDLVFKGPIDENSITFPKEEELAQEEGKRSTKLERLMSGYFLYKDN